MTSFPKAVRAFVRASLHFAFRFVRLLFILALVALPAPLTAWVVIILEPLRRSVPTQVLRQEYRPPPE